MPARSDGLTHAGGVVWQKKGSGYAYLLVTASDDPKRWVLPKGHIEPYEEPEHTAVREVLEETGCWARPSEWIDDVVLATPNQRSKHVGFYLMDVVQDLQASEQDGGEGRRRAWLPTKDAVRALSWNRDTQRLVKLAEGVLEARGDA